MNATTENGVMTIALSGHIDSANAPAAEKSILALREQPHEALVLDLRDLAYISSAGLRVILRLRRLEADLRLVNASKDVYEVLSMTGFTEMMPVEKAYRTLSIEGCEVIGRGANGTVYRIDKDTVVKVYNKSDSLPDVRRERELARKAFVLGIPTAIPYDVVRVDGRYGSVFELLNAQSFSKLILAHPENMDQYASLYVDVMHRMHSTHLRPGELPDIRDFAEGLKEYALQYLPEGQGRRLCGLLDAIPACDTLLHGDYHTNNIVMQNGEVLLIDMDTLSVGHPVFELAPMYMAFVGFGEEDPARIERFLKLPVELSGRFWQKALRLYLQCGDEARVRSVEDKARLIGYLRLMRRTIRRGGFDTEEGRATIGLCRRRIGELLDRVDSLSF